MVGAIGTAFTALCCATPLLVWILAGLGITALAGYLDLILIPLLVIFGGMLYVGFKKRKQCEQAT